MSYSRVQNKIKCLYFEAMGLVAMVIGVSGYGGAFFRALAVGEWGRSFKLWSAGRRANGFFCGGGGRFGYFWLFSEA